MVSFMLKASTHFGGITDTVSTETAVQMTTPIKNLHFFLAWVERNYLLLYRMLMHLGVAKHPAVSSWEREITHVMQCIHSSAPPPAAPVCSSLLQKHRATTQNSFRS